MATTTINLERHDLDSFCDNLPEPIIARPVLTATRGRGLMLSLEYPGALVTLTEDGKPCNFCSIDDVMFELDGVPNVDKSRLVIEMANYYRQH